MPVTIGIGVGVSQQATSVLAAPTLTLRKFDDTTVMRFDDTTTMRFDT